MSKNKESDKKFILDMIGFVSGIAIFIIFSFVLGNYESVRNEQLTSGAKYPSSTAYFLVPVFVGLITYATVVVLKGIFTLGGVLLENSRQTEMTRRG